MLALLMPTLTIRRLDENTKARLRMQAAKNGRSMEEEAREILRSSLRVVEAEHVSLAESIKNRFDAFHGVELTIPKRELVRKPPTFLE
jgi:antitoxin FitA